MCWPCGGAGHHVQLYPHLAVIVLERKCANQVSPPESGFVEYILSASDKTLLLNNKKCILLYISQQNLLLSYYILVVCDTVPLNKIMHSTSWIEEGCKYRRFTKQKTCSHWCKKCKQRAWPFLGSRLPAWGRCWGHRTKQQIWETVHCVQPGRTQD